MLKRTVREEVSGAIMRCGPHGCLAKVLAVTHGVREMDKSWLAEFHERMDRFGKK